MILVKKCRYAASTFIIGGVILILDFVEQRIKFHEQLVSSLTPTLKLFESVIAVTVVRLPISKASHVKAILQNLRLAGRIDAKARFDHCRGN